MYVKKKKTYEKIIQSFLELVAIKDFEQISVKDIAEHAKIHRITFYDHFKDKYDLLDHIYIDMKNEAIKEQNTILKTKKISSNDSISVSIYLHCFVNALKKRRQLVIALANQTGGYIYFAFETFLSDAFQKLLSLQHPEANLKYSLEQTSSFIVGGIISFVLSGYRQGKYSGDSYERIFYDAQTLIRNILSSKILFH